MDLLQLLAINAATIAGCMVTLWLISLPLSDASIVDLFWGFGFVVIGWTTFFSILAVQTTGLLLLVLVTIWGCRLTAYLLWRNVGKGEDSRYTEMREKPGRNFALFSLIVIFGLQGVIMLVVSLPVQTGVSSAVSMNWLTFVGATIWLIGLLFESIGDFQLARFKSDPANQGKVLDRGLWRYTRHPNYFGDFLVWWGLWLVAISGDSDLWWTAIGPALMTFCLLYFSGVAHLEKRITNRRPEYAAYIRRTNAFFPWPPSEEATQAAGADFQKVSRL